MNKFTFTVTDTEGSNGDITVTINEYTLVPTVLKLMKEFPFSRYIYSNAKVEYVRGKVDSISDDKIAKIMDQLISMGKV